MCDNLKEPAYAKYNGIAGAESSMKQTEKLLQGLTYRCVCGKLPREVTQVAYDSRNVEPGGIFVCIRGSRQDGHQFIRESVRRGASVILTEAATDFKQESYTVERAVHPWGYRDKRKDYHSLDDLEDAGCRRL